MSRTILGVCVHDMLRFNLRQWGAQIQAVSLLSRHSWQNRHTVEAETMYYSVTPSIKTSI